MPRISVATVARASIAEEATPRPQAQPTARAASGKLPEQRPRGEAHAVNFTIAAWGLVAGVAGVGASMLADTVANGIAGVAASSLVLVPAALRLLCVRNPSSFSKHGESRVSVTRPDGRFWPVSTALILRRRAGWRTAPRRC